MISSSKYTHGTGAMDQQEETDHQDSWRQAIEETEPKEKNRAPEGGLISRRKDLNDIWNTTKASKMANKDQQHIHSWLQMSPQYPNDDNREATE